MDANIVLQIFHHWLWFCVRYIWQIILAWKEEEFYRTGFRIRCQNFRIFVQKYIWNRPNTTQHYLDYVSLNIHSGQIILLSILLI